MEIIDFFKDERQECWIRQIEAYEWRAARFLAQLLRENTFRTIIHPGTLYLLVEDETLVSFLTLAHRDEIDDPEMYPWIGFVHTAPEWRGRGYIKVLMDHACGVAAQHGMQQVYLSTNHVGLYEKYGFAFIGVRQMQHEETRIYCRMLSHGEGTS